MCRGLDGRPALVYRLQAGSSGRKLEGPPLPLLVHAGIWSVAGAVGGAAFGLGRGERGEWPRAALGGFLGAAAAAAAYELIGVTAFPGAGTTQFISSTWPTRLLARLAVGILASAGIALAIAPPRERPVTPAP